MPMHKSSTADAKEKTQKKNLPDIAQQVCFHPKQLTYKSLVSRFPASKHKGAQ